MSENKFPDREAFLVNLLSFRQWLRIGGMLLAGFASWALTFIQIAVAILQAIHVLVMGQPNGRLAGAGSIMALYQAQIWLFNSHASDTPPWPVTDLPGAPSDLDTESTAASQDSKPSPASSSADDSDVFGDMSFESAAAHHESDAQSASDNEVSDSDVEPQAGNDFGSGPRP